MKKWVTAQVPWGWGSASARCLERGGRHGAELHSGMLAAIRSPLGTRPDVEEQDLEDVLRNKQKPKKWVSRTSVMGVGRADSCKLQGSQDRT